jgi:hypothetical protein
MKATTPRPAERRSDGAVGLLIKSLEKNEVPTTVGKARLFIHGLDSKGKNNTERAFCAFEGKSSVRSAGQDRRHKGFFFAYFLWATKESWNTALAGLLSNLSRIKKATTAAGSGTIIVKMFHF